MSVKLVMRKAEGVLELWHVACQQIMVRYQARAAVEAYGDAVTAVMIDVMPQWQNAVNRLFDQLIPIACPRCHAVLISAEHAP